MRASGTFATRDPSLSASPLWRPSEARVAAAQITRFTHWLENSTGETFRDYEALWDWSVADVGRFWDAVGRYFDVPGMEGGGPRVLGESMPEAQWFPERSVSLVESIFRHRALKTPAIVHDGETSGHGEISWNELEARVARVSQLLQDLGVKPGDRVVAYLPNVPETIVAFLATASLGAIWSVCSPDMGVPSVLQRFGQLEPAVIFCADGYRHAGRDYPRSSEAHALVSGLPSLRHVVWVPLLHLPAPHDRVGDVPLSLWPGSFAAGTVAGVRRVSFSHPLWIVFSSGTTGLPKAIVHGHGGILLNGLVQSGIHSDLSEGDRAFWLCSTSWIVWNALVCGLLVGATVCLHDGSVTGASGAEDWGLLFRFAARHKVRYFGAGAAFYQNVMRSGVHPRTAANLDELQSVASTGSPLPPGAFQWIFDSIGEHVWLTSVSGGTDIAGSFLMGLPTLPVYAGELQCRALGAAVRVYGDDGQPVVNGVGELICERPLPSMPLRFWGDPGNQRYIGSYLSEFRDSTGHPVWRQGDWLQLIPRPAATGGIVYGRSDATVNRQGIRVGTAEYYRVLESIAEISDSLVIDLEFLGRPSHLEVFVVLQPGLTLSSALTGRMRTLLREALSARHLPDEITQVQEIPRTRTGKKLEVPIRKILLGMPVDEALQRDSLTNPDSLGFFIDLARERRSHSGEGK
jgi:acetoacetyl-CoA synthetase